jgi:hypothetical protein
MSLLGRKSQTQDPLGGSPLSFAVIVSTLVVTFYNWRFWREVITQSHVALVEDLAFVVSISR